ncbi:hypothetical protein E8E12_000022, partial [Didymella heteroderae]
MFNNVKPSNMGRNHSLAKNLEHLPLELIEEVLKDLTFEQAIRLSSWAGPQLTHAFTISLSWKQHFGDERNRAIWQKYLQLTDQVNALCFDTRRDARAWFNKRPLRANNDEEYKRLKRETEELNAWKRADSALRLVILNTVPRDIYESVYQQKTPQQFSAIAARFKESGVAEECTQWGSFFGLRAHHCISTTAFTDQFKAGLTKVETMMTGGKLADKCKAYQFILAIEEAYPEYARARRGDLRRGTVPTIDTMSNELNDEARRDDPVKTAYAMAKQKTDQQKSGGGHNNNNGTSSSGGNGNGGSRRRGGRNGGQNNGSSSNDSGGGDRQKTSQPNDKPERALCHKCNHTHVGAGDSCWYTYPEKAPAEWRERNAHKLNKSKTGTNAAMVTDNSNGYSSRFAYATVKLSDDVLRKAGDGAYRDRLILDT